MTSPAPPPRPKGHGLLQGKTVLITAAAGTAMYGAAKAGLVNLTQSLAAEWGPKVRVNVVITGLITTPTAEEYYGLRGMQNIADRLPLKRMGQPKDIAQAYLFLASSSSSYVSVAQLAVHGGGEPAFILTMDKSYTYRVQKSYPPLKTEKES